MNASKNKIFFGYRLSKDTKRIVKEHSEQRILLTIQRLLARGETGQHIRQELIKRGVLNGESLNEA